MPYLVDNNAFTAQASSVVLNPSPNGSYGYRSFGAKCVMAPNIDRIVLTCGDGPESSGYTNSTWHYDIDARQFTRTRPDPSNLVGLGAFPAAPDGFIDRDSGPARGDNRHLAYHPATGKVWEWGGNVGDNAPASSHQDDTWFNHLSAGAYIYDPVTHLWAMPDMTNLTGAMRTLSGGCGWDPNINKFIQILGENGPGGFSTTDTRSYEIDPSTGAGGSIVQFSWTADGIAGPLGRINIGHQFAYHTRARKWILFGGNTTSSSGGWQTSNETWMYDAVTRTWTKLNPNGTPGGRGFGFMTYDTQNNVMVLTGGLSVGSPPSGTPVTTTWAYSLEYNTWTNLGVAFNRICGGAVYDPTRNLHLYTPGSGLSDQDVYTFRYAIPRATMITNQWYAMPQADPGLSFWPEKHMNWAYSPVTKRMYNHGGDTLQCIDQNGVNQGGSVGSYYQRDFSTDYNLRFANPTDHNIGSREEFSMCASGTQVRPKHPDFVGWVWDSKRGVFWHVPGVIAAPNQPNCSNETSTFGDDPNYLFRDHLLTFDPANPSVGWAVASSVANSGVVHPGVDWPWQSYYDPLKDQILRLEQSGDDGALQPNTYDIGTDTWSHPFLDTIPSIGGTNKSIKLVTYQFWTVDPHRRLVYVVDRLSGHLTSFDIDGLGMVDLGLLPGVSVYTGPEHPDDKGYAVFDWNARMLVYIELIEGDANRYDRIWKYDVDHPTAGPDGTGWTEIGTLPQIKIDGGAIDPSHPNPGGTSAGFDPDNNLIVMGGSFNSMAYYWAIRLSDMGVAAAPQTLPFIFALSPSSCVPGSPLFPLTVTGTLLTGGAVNWNGSPRVTIVDSDAQLRATILASDVVSANLYSVTVTTPPPGGLSNPRTFTVAFALPTMTLVWNGKVRDRVGIGHQITPDGNLDGTLTATVTTTVTRTLTHLDLQSFNSSSTLIGRWDTTTNAVFYVLGAAMGFDTALLNDPTTLAINVSVPTGTSFVVFAADAFGDIEFVDGTTLTLRATFSDGTTATGSAVAGIAASPDWSDKYMESILLSHGVWY